MKTDYQLDAKEIIQKLDHVDDLPTLPVVALELNRLLDNEDVPVAEVSALIEKDPAIVPRILKLVNSSFFGLRSQISNLSHAIVILGFSTVRNAAISVSVIDSFKGKTLPDDFDIAGFWTHAVAVAVTARRIAQKTRHVSPEDAFTAGLLHDTGKIVLGQFFPELLNTVWTVANQEQLSFYEAEKKSIAITHANIGGHLAKKWQFPPSLTEAIRWHHKFKTDAADTNLLMTLHTADALVNRLVLDATEDQAPILFSPEDSAHLDALVTSAAEWFPEVRDDIDEACQLFLTGL